MAAEISTLERRRGRLLFAAGLAGWLAMAKTVLPYDFGNYGNMFYLLPARFGAWSGAVLTHPLFVPLISGLRRLFGEPTRLLEGLTLAVAFATLIGVFLALERRCRDSSAAALAALALAFSPGFGRAALDFDSYALAFAFFLLTLELLVRARGRVGRHAAAGAAAGLAASFHLALLTLLVPAAWASWSESGPRRGRAQRWACFAAVQGGIVAAAFWLLARVKGLDYGLLAPHGWRPLLRSLQEIHDTSLFTQPHPLELLRAFAGSLLFQAGPALWLCAAAWPLLRVTGAGLEAPESERRALGICGAAAGALSLFFAFGNSRNGFIYACWGPMLLWLALALARLRASRTAYVAVAVAVFAVSGLFIPAYLSLRRTDGPWLEARFLARALRPADILVTAGCPDPTLLYDGDFRLLGVAAPGGSRWSECEFPVAPMDESLTRRLSDALAQGRRVLVPERLALAYAPWAEREMFGLAPQDRFWLASNDKGQQGQFALREFLSRRFGWKQPLRSELGAEYDRLALRGRAAPPPAGQRAPSLDDLSALRARSAGAPAFMRRRLDRIADWARASPDDAHVREDLARWEGDLTAATTGPENEAAARAKAAPPPSARRPPPPRPAPAPLGAAELDAGVRAYLAGQADAALGHFAAALALTPCYPEALLSRGAIWAGRGRWSDAMTDYDAALRCRPLAAPLRGAIESARAEALRAQRARP